MWLFTRADKRISENLRKKSDGLRSQSRPPPLVSPHHDFCPVVRNVPAGVAEGGMSVLYLTIFISLMLALFFAAGFLYHHDFSGGDPLRDSLLPFRQEKSDPPAAPAAEEKPLP